MKPAMSPAPGAARNNLFVVSSPLQLFNAIEARDRFHAADANRLLVIWTRDIDRAQMLPLLDDRWREVRWYRFKGWRRSLYALALRPWLRAQQPVDTLYIGYPYNVRAHIANTLGTTRTVLVDDGHATLEITDYLADPVLRRRDDPHPGDRLFGRHTGMDYAATLHVFSVYALPGWPAERYVHNDFRAFRARVAALPAGDTLLFIGSPLAGNLVPGPDDEVALLHAMARHYAPRPVRYAAHRYEDLARLQALPGLANVTFMRYDTLLEYALFREGILPARIATFCSSAIDTLTRIYPVGAEVLRIPEARMLPGKRAWFEELYRNYASRGITVTDPGPERPSTDPAAEKQHV